MTELHRRRVPANSCAHQRTNASNAGAPPVPEATTTGKPTAYRTGSTGSDINSMRHVRTALRTIPAPDAEPTYTTSRPILLLRILPAGRTLGLRAGYIECITEG